MKRIFTDRANLVKRCQTWSNVVHGVGGLTTVMERNNWACLRWPFLFRFGSVSQKGEPSWFMETSFPLRMPIYVLPSYYPSTIFFQKCSFVPHIFSEIFKPEIRRLSWGFKRWRITISGLRFLHKLPRVGRFLEFPLTYSDCMCTQEESSWFAQIEDWEIEKSWTLGVKVLNDMIFGCCVCPSWKVCRLFFLLSFFWFKIDHAKFISSWTWCMFGCEYFSSIAGDFIDFYSIP